MRSTRCACGLGNMTVKHVILTCPKWREQRRAHLGEVHDLKQILTNQQGATAAIRMILATDILAQFREVGR